MPQDQTATPPPPGEQKPKTLIEKYGRAKVFLGAVLLVVIMETLAFYFLRTEADLKFFNILTPTVSPATTQKPIIASPTLDPTTNWKTYTNNDFTFLYPDYVKIDHEEKDKVVWKFTNGDLMILKRQQTAFRQPEVHKSMDYLTSGTIVTKIEAQGSMKLSNKEAKGYVITCGSDCYEYIVQFQVGNNYYQLAKDIAGAGLKETFQQILSTFKFIE